MASGQKTKRLPFIYGYKIVGSSTRVPSLTLHSNGCPVSVSRAAFHFRSALLWFCSSPMFQFTSGALLSLCKPNKPYCHTLRPVALQPRSLYRMLKMIQVAAKARVTLQALKLARGHWASSAFDEPHHCSLRIVRVPIKLSAGLTA